MSLYSEASPKHCGAKQHTQGLRAANRRRLLYGAFSCVLTVAAAGFLVYLVLRPTKPAFALREAELYQLSLAAPADRLLNSTLHVTLLSSNPNTRVGVYYDQLRAYAAYRGQRITSVADIPPFFQDHQDSNLLSASLYGSAVPVASSLGHEVVRDQTAGRILLRLRIHGRLRWKVAAWVSPQYHVDVDCTAFMAFGVDGAASSTTATECSTTV